MKKSDVKTIEDVEQYYSQVRKIKFRDVNPDNIKDCIELMTAGNHQSTTVYTRGGFHCFADRRRSLDDIIKICKFYYPEKTVKQILKEVIKISIQKNTLNEQFYHLGYCGTIRKHNFHNNRWYGKTDKEKVDLIKKATLQGVGGFDNQLTINDLIK